MGWALRHTIGQQKGHGKGKAQFGMGKGSICHQMSTKKCGFFVCGWEDEVGVGDAMTSWADCMVKLLQNRYFLCQNWGAKNWFVLTLTEVPQREVVPDLTS